MRCSELAGVDLSHARKREVAESGEGMQGRVSAVVLPSRVYLDGSPTWGFLVSFITQKLGDNFIRV